MDTSAPLTTVTTAESKSGKMANSQSPPVNNMKPIDSMKLFSSLVGSTRIPTGSVQRMEKSSKRKSNEPTDSTKSSAKRQCHASTKTPRQNTSEVMVPSQRSENDDELPPHMKRDRLAKKFANLHNMQCIFNKRLSILKQSKLKWMHFIQNRLLWMRHRKSTENWQSLNGCASSTWHAMQPIPHVEIFDSTTLFFFNGTHSNSCYQ